MDKLLQWQTIFEAPGNHALQAGIILNNVDDAQGREAEQKDRLVLGPFIPVTITNLCQFTPDSAIFAPGASATVRAKLPKENGTYIADFTAESGKHLKPFAGAATNGMIVLDWDLMDENGRLYTEKSFSSLFEVTLPESGRLQKLAGP